MLDPKEAKALGGTPPTSIDGLTGAYNRHHLTEQIGRELEHVRHGERLLALVRFDIERFKRVNDLLQAADPARGRREARLGDDAIQSSR